MLAVDGNTLVVRLPEGTRELSVADDFRFIIDGKPMSVRELKVGMKGSATITTKTTMTPVTVTEVKNGTVVQRSGGTIVVRMPDNQVRRFSQSDIDKRGIKIVRDGRPADINDFREGDTLTATIITTRQPQVLTEREVQATLAPATAAAAPPAPRAVPAAPARRPRPAPASGGAATGPKGDVAVNGQLVATPRARECPVARDGACAHCQAPLQPLGDLPFPVPRSRVSARARP